MQYLAFDITGIFNLNNYSLFCMPSFQILQHRKQRFLFLNILSLHSIIVRRSLHSLDREPNLANIFYFILEM